MAKILLVEDDSNLREIYGARLEAEGYQIFSASDGEEALALAVQEQPELVISDVMMPKISGFDMLDILRTTPETKNVKVIVMTALGQDEDKKRGEELGADRYIVKSQVTLDDVVQIVHEVMGDGSAPQPVTAPVDPQATQPVQDINDQVADFVASSPLMNGTAPTMQPPVVPQQQDTVDDQQDEQTPEQPLQTPPVV